MKDSVAAPATGETLQEVGAAAGLGLRGALIVKEGAA